MKSILFSLKSLSAIIVLFVVATLFVVSVLGENNSAKSIIHRYLSALESNDTKEISILLSEKFANQFENDSELASYNGALGIALFDHFDIDPEREYIINVNRKSTWFPLVGSDNLKFDLKIRQNEDTKFLASVVDGDGKKLIDFLTLTREDGGWKIENIDIKNKIISDKIEKINRLEQALTELIIGSNGNITTNYNKTEGTSVSLQNRIIINRLKSAISTFHKRDK